MAKWFGKVCYSATEEESPGIWHGSIVREYYGDVTRLSRRLQTGEKTNDDIVLSNAISIIADPFAYENFSTIVWVEYMGTKWSVTDIDVQRPRLTLTLGGIYNDGD